VVTSSSLGRPARWHRSLETKWLQIWNHNSVTGMLGVFNVQASNEGGCSL